MKVDPAVQKMLDKAKLTMMMRPKTVFYTTILFSLKQIWDDTIPTATTNGLFLNINPNWFQKLTTEQQIGLLSHEVLHVALDHITRMGNRDCVVMDSAGQPHSLWNIAADHAINLSLLNARYQLPTNGCWDQRFSNRSTEQIYDILFDEIQKAPPGAGDAIPGGWGGDIEHPDVANNDKVKAEISQIILQAATTAKMSGEDPGCLPAGVLLQLEEILNPKLPWEMILRNYFTEFSKDDFNMQRPNRRFLPDHYLPSAYSEAVANLVFALDGSGSVLPKEFSYFIAECGAIQNYLQPEKMTLIIFDTEITGIHDITQNTDIIEDVKFHGGGGTEIEPVFEWAEENTPEVIIVFTDGYMNIPAEAPPGVSIIWLIHDNPKFTAPYGEVIHYEI